MLTNNIMNITLLIYMEQKITNNFSGQGRFLGIGALQ